MQATTTAHQIAFYQQQLDTVAPSLRQKLLRMDLAKALAQMPDISPKVREKLQTGNNRLTIETLLTEVKTTNCWESFFAFLQRSPELAPFGENFKYTPPAESPKHINYMRVHDGIVYDQHGNVVPQKRFAPGTAVGILIDSSCKDVVLKDVHVDGLAISSTPLPAPNPPEPIFTYDLQPGEPLTLPAGKKRCAITCNNQSNVTLGADCVDIRIERVSNGTVNIGNRCSQVHIILYYKSHVTIQDNCRNILIERIDPNCTYTVGNNCTEIFIDRVKIC